MADAEAHTRDGSAVASPALDQAGPVDFGRYGLLLFAAIGRYLFATSTPAGRSAYGKELMRSGGVDLGDLHELEAIARELSATRGEAWER